MSDTSETPQNIQLHAVVHGRVQGVGFRMATQRAAAENQVTGWVKNNWDGTVETVAEGPRSAVEAFEHFLHQGPRAATVERVEVTYNEMSGTFNSFNIRY